MAALGDSITTAANAARGRFGDHPNASWATGAGFDDGVTSHYERLLTLHPSLEGQAANLARSGARMADLPRQAQAAVDHEAKYVTILMGANDACAGNLSAMTPVEDYRRDLREALGILRDGLSEDAVVYVLSLPDVSQIPERVGRNPTARLVWSYAGACQALLAEDATAQAREAVRARVMAYNQVLREEATAFGVHFDDEAVFRSVVEPADLSPVDFFHPSLRGQQRLADVAWAAGPFSAAAPFT